MKSRLAMFRRLNNSMYISKNKLLIFFFVSVLAMLPDIAYPFVYKYFIDNVLTAGVIGNLLNVIISLLILLVLKVLLSYLLVYSRNIFMKKSMLLLKMKLLDNFFSRKFSYIQATKPSDIKMVIDEDTKEVHNFFTKQFVSYSTELLKLVVICTIMITLNYVLFIFCLLFFVFSLLQTHHLRKKVMTVYEESRKISAEEVDTIREDLYLWREVKSLNIENKIVLKFEMGLRRLAKLIFREKLYEFYSYYFGALNNTLISNFFVYLAGGLLIISNHLSVSSFLVFVGFYGTSTSIIQSIISSNLEFTKNSIHLEKVLKEIESDDPGQRDKIKLADGPKMIEFKNVNFKYSRGNDWLINDFCYEFSGENIYVVKGRSGKGKSTLAKILCRELEPESGSVSFNGININKVIDLYQKLSLTGKESKIFNTTIFENLLYANNKATISEIDEACKKAEIYDMIQKLPDKYDTVIGENGIKLSGGERQRLALARVFLRKCDIYILDEATSEIGADVEHRIITRLKDNNASSIIMIITHREIELGGAKHVYI